jgi:hypothetical protein
VIKVAISFLIFGTAILAVSTGLLLMTEIQLDRRPENPVSLLLIAEKTNLTQTKQVSQAGLMVGVAVVVLSATTSFVLYWRDR